MAMFYVANCLFTRPGTVCFMTPKNSQRIPPPRLRPRYGLRSWHQETPSHRAQQLIRYWQKTMSTLVVHGLFNHPGWFKDDVFPFKMDKNPIKLHIVLCVWLTEDIFVAVSLQHITVLKLGTIWIWQILTGCYGKLAMKVYTVDGLTRALNRGWFCRRFYSQAWWFSFLLPWFSIASCGSPILRLRANLVRSWHTGCGSQLPPGSQRMLRTLEKMRKINAAELWTLQLPTGKHTQNYGKSPLLMDKSTISVAMFNSYVCLSEGTFSVDLRVFVPFVPSFCWMNSPYVAWNGQSTESSWCWLPTGHRYIHILHGML